jgi:hypothetical protein
VLLVPVALSSCSSLPSWISFFLKDDEKQIGKTELNGKHIFINRVEQTPLFIDNPKKNQERKEEHDDKATGTSNTRTECI